MTLCCGPDTCRDMHDFDFYVECLGGGKFSKFFNLKRTSVRWWSNDIIINVRTESLVCLVAQMKMSISSLAKRIVSWFLHFIRDTLAKSPKQPHSAELHDIRWHEESFAYSAASHPCLVSQPKKAPQVPQGLGKGGLLQHHSTWQETEPQQPCSCRWNVLEGSVSTPFDLEDLTSCAEHGQLDGECHGRGLRLSLLSG